MVSQSAELGAHVTNARPKNSGMANMGKKRTFRALALDSQIRSVQMTKDNQRFCNSKRIGPACRCKVGWPGCKSHAKRCFRLYSLHSETYITLPPYNWLEKACILEHFWTYRTQWSDRKLRRTNCFEEWLQLFWRVTSGIYTRNHFAVVIAVRWPSSS